MKVILLQDIYKQGVAGEIVDVADGYARNYLIPTKRALKSARLCPSPPAAPSLPITTSAAQRVCMKEP